MNFDKLMNFLATLGFKFNMIFISEIWFSDQNSNNDLHKITNYSNIRLVVFVDKI